MKPAKLTKAQDERFDEAKLYLYHPDGSHLNEKAVKQHLADELQRQREEIFIALRYRVNIDLRTLKGIDISWPDVKEVFEALQTTNEEKK